MAFGGSCLFSGEHSEYLSCKRCSGIDFQVVESQAVHGRALGGKGISWEKKQRPKQLQ